MAKINHAKRECIWKVPVHATDPHCKWNIKPQTSYMKIIKANTAVAAAKLASKYCDRQMQAFPGVTFAYNSEGIEPYYCFAYEPATKENL